MALSSIQLFGLYIRIPRHTVRSGRSLLLVLAEEIFPFAALFIGEVLFV